MRRCTSLLLLSIPGVCAISAQSVTFGIKGGISLLDRTPPTDESRPYIVGGSVEVRLPARFAIEADALYQRIGNSSADATIPSGINLVPLPSLSSFTSRYRGNVWEFPVLGKYYLRPQTAAWQRFVGLGPSFRLARIHYSTTETLIGGDNLQPVLHSGNVDDGFHAGAAATAGVRFKAGRIGIVPELRYTHWAAHDAPIRRNEAAVMLGLTF